jgi:enoyl-CoA hydratase/carnithine racemase
MGYETIIYKKQERIAEIIINRPQKMNAISMSMVKEMLSALEDAGADDNVGVVILSGAGEKAFSAGDDIKDPEWTDIGYNWMPGEMFIKMRQRHFWRLVTAIRELWKPVIASVQGWCIGSAPSLVLACDIIFASETAKFSVPFINIGVVTGTSILPRAVGYHKACELHFTGEIIDGKEAERIGLINHAVPSEKLESSVTELAQKLARQATPLIGWTKWALNKAMGNYQEAQDLEILAMALTHPSKYIPRLIERPEGMIFSQKK